MISFAELGLERACDPQTKSHWNNTTFDKIGTDKKIWTTNQRMSYNSRFTFNEKSVTLKITTTETSLLKSVFNYIHQLFGSAFFLRNILYLDQLSFVEIFCILKTHRLF